MKDWAARAGGIELAATTGIAALNLGGTTINALLGYFDTKSLMDKYTTGSLTARLGRLWRAGVRRIVLDEVSMLDGDQLTYLVKGIEEVNERGYVIGKWRDEEDGPPPQMGLTLVGDFAQLRPVEGIYAWESGEWGRFAGETITLTEIRRQQDRAFVEVLRQARVGNGKAVVEFFGDRLQGVTDDHFDGPTLLATNAAVDRYNWIRMQKVVGRELFFESTREGRQRSEWGDPKKPPNTWGVPLRLHLKVGTLVMILANQRVEGPPPQPFLFVNGDLGTVVDTETTPSGDHTCYVQLHRNGRVVEVTYIRREVLEPIDSARRRELIDQGKTHLMSENRKYEIVGWVEYMPLRVAYASTVHKSQGLSLDKVQVNVKEHFFKTPGMLYVALSRARTAAGLRLVGSAAAIIERCAVDPRLKPWL